MPGLWIRLIILHIRQAFEDALGSKCARVLNMPWLYMQGLHRFLNVWIYLNNAWIWLNIPECLWTCLNAWVNCPDYVQVLSMPHHQIFDWVLNILQALNMLGFWTSRDIVIITLLRIVTNVNILEFFFFRFVHPSALQLTIISFFNRS